MSTRPTIFVRPPEHMVADESREALAGKSGLYLRAGRLAYVCTLASPEVSDHGVIPPGNVLIKNVGPALLRERLSEAANYMRLRAGASEPVSALVPDYLPGMILEEPGGAGFPDLRCVVTVPVVLADGSIHATRGVLREGILYEGREGCYEVPEYPSEEERQHALEELYLVVADFPWPGELCGNSHRAAWIACLFTIVGRFSFEGQCPYGVIDGNTSSAGKGLLATITAIICTGAEPPAMTCPSNEEELRKSILPVLAAGTRLQLLDELQEGFGGKHWNGMVTSKMYRGRILGTSTIQTVGNDTFWLCTGNNVSLQPESARRCLYLRLETFQDHPESRSGFRIPNLVDYVIDNQAKLLRSVLTLLRAFIVAGRPASGLAPWGSFESWSRTVRDAVVFATGVDPDCRGDLDSTADQGRILHADLIRALRGTFGAKPFTTRVAIDRCGEDQELRDALEAVCPARDGVFSPGAVGKRFSALRRRPAKGFLLEQCPDDDRGGGRRWCIQSSESMQLRSRGTTT